MKKLAILASLALAACAADKLEPQKGEVDESPPEGTPADDIAGKADSLGPNVITLTTRYQSAHPYTNNLNKTYSVDLSTVVPSCATSVKLHFSVLNTEAGYDYVSTVNGQGAVVQTWDGTRGSTWSDWVTLSDTKKMSIRLTSDYSVVKDGFTVDQVEWQGRITCPAPPDYLCSDDQIDLRQPAPVCGCRGLSHCTPLTTVSITHSVGGGFTGQVTGTKTVGADVYQSVWTVEGGESSTHVGTIDADALKQLLNQMAGAGVLWGPGRAESSNWTECFIVTTDQESISYCAPQGSHTALVADFIARFDGMLSCSAGSLACDSSLSCDGNGACSRGCVCTANYNPVCGANGHTYSNACAEACAAVGHKHDGQCGIAGDTCGANTSECLDGFKCRYGTSVWSAPNVDAAGSCVAATYCDAAADCAGLIHPAVWGAWACLSNVCTYQPGSTWQDSAGFRFETAHPYANNASVWQQLYLPDGAAKMRLITAGVFALEQGYDFLEVWTWKSGAWQRVKRYTGAVGPSAGDEFPGQYHYLKFVSDVSVTGEGFNLIAQYSTQP